MVPFLKKIAPFVVIFGIAFIFRFIYLLEIKATPLLSVLMGDALSYDLWAQEIAAGNWLGSNVFYQAPFYPYFLGFIYSLWGHELFTVHLIQILIGSFSCLFLTKAGINFFDQKTGWIAGLLLAIYPPALFFDNLIQKGVFGLFFTSLTLCLISQIQIKKAAVLLILSGIVLGLFTLTRENALLLFFLILFWLFIQEKESIKHRFLSIILFSLGLCLILIPVGLRNQAVSGDFLITTAQFGPNFYIGNNKKANGQYNPLISGRGNPEYEQIDAIRLAEQAKGQKLSPKEVSGYWTQKTIQEIQEEPEHWLSLMWRKWRFVWNTKELVDTESFEIYLDHSWLLSSLKPFFHFGILAPLGLVGIILTWGERKKLWILYAMLLLLALGVALFYVFARYRLPMIPILILFSAIAIHKILFFIQTKQIKKLKTSFFIFIAVALFVNWPIKLQANQRAIAYNNLGIALSLKGEPEKSLKYLFKAIQLAPKSISPKNNLASSLKKIGKTKEAISIYEQVLNQKPNNLEALLGLGLLYAQKNQMESALMYYQRAKKLAPKNPEIYNNLGNSYLISGEIDRAVENYLATLKLKPDHFFAHLNLANAYQKQGKRQKAIETYEKGLQINPNHIETIYYLAQLYEAEGNVFQAIELYQKAIQLNPNFIQAKEKLNRLSGLLK